MNNSIDVLSFGDRLDHIAALHLKSAPQSIMMSEEMSQRRSQFVDIYGPERSQQNRLIEVVTIGDPGFEKAMLDGSQRNVSRHRPLVNRRLLHIDSLGP